MANKARYTAGLLFHVAVPLSFTSVLTVTVFAGIDCLKAFYLIIVAMVPYLIHVSPYFDVDCFPIFSAQRIAIGQQIGYPSFCSLMNFRIEILFVIMQTMKGFRVISDGRCFINTVQLLFSRLDCFTVKPTR